MGRTAAMGGAISEVSEANLASMYRNAGDSRRSHDCGASTALADLVGVSARHAWTTEQCQRVPRRIAGLADQIQLSIFEPAGHVESAARRQREIASSSGRAGIRVLSAGLICNAPTVDPLYGRSGYSERSGNKLSRAVERRMAAIRRSRDGQWVFARLRRRTGTQRLAQLWRSATGDARVINALYQSGAYSGTYQSGAAARLFRQSRYYNMRGSAPRSHSL